MSDYDQQSGTAVNVDLDGFEYEQRTGTTVDIELQLSETFERTATTGSSGSSSSSQETFLTFRRTSTTRGTGSSSSSRELFAVQIRTASTGASGASSAARGFGDWRVGGISLKVTSDLEADAETIALAAPADADTRARLRDLVDRTGDVDTDEGFAGTFRAFDRSGGEAVTLEAPFDQSPPFPTTQPVLVEDASEEQVATDRVDAELDLRRLTNRDDATDIDGTIATGDDWTFSLAHGTIALSEQQVGQIDREGDTPGASVTLPLILSDEQAAALLDSVGYPAGVVVESVPDGPDQRVDETRGRQTIDLDAPAEAMIDSGEWYVTDWSLELWSFSEDREWLVELTLAES